MTSLATSGPLENGGSRDRVLVIDDEPDMCELLHVALTRYGYAVHATSSVADALEYVARERPEVVVTDLGMAELDGLELCERVLAVMPGAEVIVLTGRATMETAIAALRSGASEFLVKPVEMRHLALAVARAATHRRLVVELARLRATIGTTVTPTLVGTGEAMSKVHDLIARVAPSEASVLIHGETGTGKELVAHAIHRASGRRDGPFVAVNCAAIPATLLESELFGHARGAFTDAKEARTGLFMQATGGTLFLDEIGEMALEMQPKLLRALQERVVRPVGGAVETRFDVRIVVATNRNLEAEILAKRFREDLYYRINVVRIDLPPLRDRGTDVLTLAHHFLAHYAARDGKPGLTLSVQVAERLTSYAWPGNVRELQNCVERAAVMARYDELAVDDLPERVRAYTKGAILSADDVGDIVSVDELERRYLLRVIALLSGNKSRAAELLGMDRRTLYRRLDRYEADDAKRAALRAASPSPTP